MLTKKRKFIEKETIELEAGCNAIIHKSFSNYNKGSFTILVRIRESYLSKALDLETSINLMPLSTMKSIGNLEAKPTIMTVQLANILVKHPYGVI